MKLLAFFFDMFGRVRRRDVWVFFAGLAVLYSLLFSLAHDQAVRAGAFDTNRGDLYSVNWLSHNELAFIGFVVLQIITLSVVIKRYHDRNKSGLWALVGLVPIIGQAWVIFELGFLPGTDGANRYGPSPRGQIHSL